MQPTNRNTWDDDARHLAELALLLVHKQRARPDLAVLKSLLKHLCREAEDTCPRYVSQRAHEVATSRGLPDLRQFHWDEQPHRMGDRGRDVFHWEHFAPVSQMVKALVALPPAATSADAFQLFRRARIVWILKEEDEELSKRGYSSHRPNPYEAYRDARIDLIGLAEEDCLAWQSAG